MTLVHMAPQVPLPDRLHQGRVQLLEVKYTPAPLFEVQSVSNPPHDMKALGEDELHAEDVSVLSA